MRKFLRQDCEGEAVISYALMLGLLALVCFTSLMALEDAFTQEFTEIAAKEMAEGAGNRMPGQRRGGIGAASVRGGTWP